MVDIVSIIIASTSLILTLYTHIKYSKCCGFKIQTIYDNTPQTQEIHIHNDSPPQLKRLNNSQSENNLKVKFY